MGEGQTEPSVVSDAEMEALLQAQEFNAVRAEVDKLEQSKRSFLTNIVLLAVSLMAFIGAGFLKASWESTAILVAVIFIHELGHWLGMRCFGYRNLSMFFIPYFGAAVSGRKMGVPGWQEVIVSLLGPVPGIILGVVAWVLQLRTGNDLYLQYAKVSLYLNVFNLLPFLPLDGGRVWNALLFSRHPILESIFKVVAALVLVALAYFKGSIVMGVLAFFMLATAKEIYFYSKTARWFREGWKDQLPEPSEHLPDEYLTVLLPYMREGLPTKQATKERLAARVYSVWQRLFKKPPRLWTSIALGFVYSVFLLLGTVGCIATVVSFASYKTIQRTLNDGRVVSVEVTSFGSKISGEQQLNEQGEFDGPVKGWYSTDHLEVEGQYVRGYRDGKWTNYDREGKVVSAEYYENGHPVKFEKIIDGNLREVPSDQWPQAFKNYQQSKPRKAQPQKAK